MAIPPKVATKAKAPIKQAPKTPVKQAAVKTIKVTELLKEIFASKFNEAGYMFVNSDYAEIQNLQNQGLIELNLRMIDEDGNVAARISEKGADLCEKEGVQVAQQTASIFAQVQNDVLVDEMEQEDEEAYEEEAYEEEAYEEEAYEETEAEEMQTNNTEFQLEDGIPKRAVKLRKRKSAYPIDIMQPGQSFLIKATAERPDPAKSLTGIISAANKRYAVPTGDTKVSRTGKELPVLRYTRRYSMVAVEGGARVFRDK